MNARIRASGIPTAADVALAFGAGIAFFVVLAAAIPVRDHTVLIVVWGGLTLYAVIWVARRAGPLFGAPLAIAAGFAFDAFYIPPTRNFGGDNWQNWLVLGIYVGLGVLIGLFAARERGRGELSELARDALAGEQAALRRVATLVAEGVPSKQLFDAVAREVGTLLGADFAGMIRYEDDGTVTTTATWAAVGEHPPVPDRWPMEPGDPASMIAERRRPARVDDWASVPGPIAAVIREQLAVRSSIGYPIVVEGELWGALAVHSKHDASLPPESEARIGQFTDLVATAIGNADARAETARLTQEQAALRRVATLVAREASQAEVFTAIAEEIGQLLGTEEIRMLRYENDAHAVVVASAGAAAGVFPVGSHYPLNGDNAASRVFRTGRGARIDEYATASGPIADAVRPIGIRSVVAEPIFVERRPWGAMVTGTTRDEPLPPETEWRFAQFTELMATAIANTESRGKADRLAEEQAALRRVATLVAEEAASAKVFAKVVEEVAHVLGDVDSALVRDDGDGSVTSVAVWGPGMSAGFPVGARMPVDGNGVTASVLRDGQPHRIDAYLEATGAIADRGREHGMRSAVGCPVVVRGRIWGVMGVANFEGDPLPPDTEARITQFSELVATAIANAEARAEVERLAEEQAALRRLATLVAEGAAPTTVLDAVAAEMERVLDADGVTLSRYEPDDEVTVVAHRGSDAWRVPPGTRVKHDGDNVTTKVRRSEQPARMEHAWSGGAIADLVDELGVLASVGAPIVVDGRLWGVVIANWRGEDPPPADTEERMAQFAELLDTAIANADSRDKLVASRTRLLTAADEARRRVVRDLHDGAQQRLVHTIITLKLAQRALGETGGELHSLVGEALEQAQQGNNELRELARGILPAVLARGGLRAGVDTFVARVDLPVDVDLPAERFPAEIEASAYFIVAEALTNVVKHAQADRAVVTAAVADGALHIEVRDDGVGGADPDGHGLVGLADRATALGGRLKVVGPPGGGTLLTATLPLPGG